MPGIEINIFIDASHAGSFIQKPQSISKPGRVIVTSSNQDKVAYVSPDSTYFSEHFVTALRGGANLHKSWEKASSNIRTIFPTEFQEPWIDGNGNGIHNEPNDFTIAAQRHLDQMGTLGDMVLPKIIHTGMEENNTVITATVSDGQNIASVWAVIYPPSYVTRTNRSMSVAADGLNIVELEGSDTEDNTYRGDSYDFAEQGTYRIVVQAKDEDGLVAEPNVMVIEIMVPEITEPEIAEREITELEIVEPEIMESEIMESEIVDTSQRLFLPFVSQ